MNALSFQRPGAGSEVSRKATPNQASVMHTPFVPSPARMGASGTQRAVVGIIALAVQALFVVGLALGLMHEPTTKIALPMTVNLFPEEKRELEAPPAPLNPRLQTPEIVVNLPPPPQIYSPPPLVQANAPPSPITSTTMPPPYVDPNVAIQAFQLDLLRQINRNLRYPPGARAKRQEGVVLVRFTMDRRGNVSDVSIEQGSNFGVLNEESIAVLMRASPFPPPPPELEGGTIDMILPVKFSLRGPGGGSGRGRDDRFVHRADG